MSYWSCVALSRKLLVMLISLPESTPTKQPSEATCYANSSTDATALPTLILTSLLRSVFYLNTIIVKCRVWNSDELWGLSRLSRIQAMKAFRKGPFILCSGWMLSLRDWSFHTVFLTKVRMIRSRCWSLRKFGEDNRKIKGLKWKGHKNWWMQGG